MAELHGGAHNGGGLMLLFGECEARNGSAPVTLAASYSVPLHRDLLSAWPQVPAAMLDYQMQFGSRAVCAVHTAQKHNAGCCIKTIMERKINIVLQHAPLAPADPIIVFIFCSFS